MKTITLVLLLFVISGHAQMDSTKILKRSLLTGNVIGELPFDEVFYLEEDIKKEQKVESLEVRKMRNGKYVTFTKNEEETIKSVYGKVNVDLTDKTLARITLTKSKHYNVRGEKAYIQIFPLAPATNYEFKVTKEEISIEKATPKNIQSVKDAHNVDPATLSDNKGVLLNSIDITKEDGQNKVSTAIVLYRTHSGKLNNAIQALIDYDQRLGNSGKKLKSRITRLITLESTLESIDLRDAFDQCYNVLVPAEMECDTCDKHKFNICKDSCFQIMLLPPQETFSEINLGILPLYAPHEAKPKKTLDFEGRAENIGLSLNYIEKLMATSNFVLPSKCDALLAERDKLFKNRSILLELLKKWTEVVNDITNYVIVKSKPLKSFATGGGTGPTGGGITLSSKGKFVVRPDFGVGFASSIVGVDDPTGAFTKVAPFGGVRINLRPLNPNIPYRLIMNKSFWHHSSINIGLTTNSFSDGATRFDLFKKTNFVLGYGYRLNNAMNLSAGAIFFQRLNSDPFINSNRLAAMPYIGLTIDFEILETFNTFINVLSN